MLRTSLLSSLPTSLMSFDGTQEVNKNESDANYPLFDLSGDPSNIVGDITITGLTIESQEQGYSYSTTTFSGCRILQDDFTVGRSNQ